MIVEFHRLAEAELLKSLRWYGRRSKGIAIDFLGKVREATRAIAKDPVRFAAFDNRHRWVKVPKYPYIIVFKNPTPARIVIIAVAHAHRRPGYWRRRK